MPEMGDFTKRFQVEVVEYQPPVSEYSVWIAFIPGDTPLYGTGASKPEAMADFTERYVDHF